MDARRTARRSQQNCERPCGPWASRRGDCVAVVLENCAEMFQVYLAVTQIGMYMTPINHHLTGPRDCLYRARFSGAKVFIGSARFGDDLQSRTRRELGVPTRQDHFPWATVEGFSLPGRAEGRPVRQSFPTNRCGGSGHELHLGNHGKPKGVRRPLADTLARHHRVTLMSAISRHVRHRSPKTTTSTSVAHRSTTRRSSSSARTPSTLAMPSFCRTSGCRKKC